jgi:hypothetical protein
MDTTPLILTGPPGCGKSHWIQTYATTTKRQLFVCPCRKDRTLRDGRQKLHIWARRTEPAILWLEGADDLTPEAQAFLRRILETHAPEIQFILECRDAGKLQEPIRSRCKLQRFNSPKLNIPFLNENEYSYRRLQQIEFLKSEYPEILAHCISHREQEKSEILVPDKLPEYIQKGYNPEVLLGSLLSDNLDLLASYGKCIEDSGSIWAFLGSSMYALSLTDAGSKTKGDK